MASSCVAAAEHFVDDKPDGPRPIAAEVTAFTVSDDVVEIELRRAFRLALGPVLALVFARCSVELGDDLVDQRVAIGEHVRGSGNALPVTAMNRSALPIGFDRHAVRARHRLLAMHLGPVPINIMRRPVRTGDFNVAVGALDQSRAAVRARRYGVAAIVESKAASSELSRQSPIPSAWTAR